MANRQPLDPIDHHLRLITILTFFPAMALGIPAAALSSRAAVLGFALIPMAASVLLAGLTLMGHKVFSRWMFPVADAGIVAGLLGLLIPYWIVQQNSWNTSSIVLGTYATVPMLVNLVIHSYYTLRAIKVMGIMTGLFSSPTCPHCNHKLLGSQHGASDWTLPRSRRSSGSGGSKESYHPITQVDNAGEASAAGPAATYNDSVEDDARTATGCPSMVETRGKYSYDGDEAARLV